MIDSTFCQDVKLELVEKFPPDTEGQMAELAGLIASCSHLTEAPRALYLHNDSLPVLEKAASLLKKLFQAEGQITAKNSRTWELALEGRDQIEEILDVLGMIENFRIVHGVPFSILESSAQVQCYLRGAFLGCGFIADPLKQYSLELTDPDEGFLQEMAELMNSFDLEVRIAERKRSSSTLYVLYLKNGEQIVDFLNVCQAYTSLMNLENIRIEKEIRNQINRTVNCEAANLNKTIQAGLKQLEDIQYLIEKLGWEGLPKGLSEMARIRLEHPDESLTELGEHFDPPVGRSGINHRLRRLSELAEKQRMSEGKPASQAMGK